MKQLFAVIALTSAFLVPANTVWAACTNNHAAKDLIQTTTKKVLDALATNAVDTESILKQHVVPSFDWERMSKWALGKNKQGKSKWKKATRDQRSRFIEAFESLLIRTYKASLNEVAGIDFEIKYLPVCGRDLTKRVKVRARVIQGGNQYSVNFKMSKSKRTRNKWKAYDVVVEGVRLLLNYKNEFKPLTIEQAIAKMNSKNQNAQ